MIIKWTDHLLSTELKFLDIECDDRLFTEIRSIVEIK